MPTTYQQLEKDYNEASCEVLRLTALLDAEMESNQRLTARELELSAEVERWKQDKTIDNWKREAKLAWDKIERLTAEVERKDEVLNMIAHTAKQRKREIKRLRRTITELTADKGRSEDG